MTFFFGKKIWDKKKIKNRVFFFLPLHVHLFQKMIYSFKKILLLVFFLIFFFLFLILYLLSWIQVSIEINRSPLLDHIFLENQKNLFQNQYSCDSFICSLFISNHNNKTCWIKTNSQDGIFPIEGKKYKIFFKSFDIFQQTCSFKEYEKNYMYKETKIIIILTCIFFIISFFLFFSYFPYKQENFWKSCFEFLLFCFFVTIIIQIILLLQIYS